MLSGIIYVFLATVLFSSMDVAIKLTGGVFNPLQLNFLRFSIGALMLLPMSISKLKKANYKLSKKDYLNFIVLGFIYAVLSMSLYTFSLEYVSASIASVLFCCNTFFSIILAAIFLKEKTNIFTKMALVICFIGILVIINPLNINEPVFGIAIVIISALIFAVYSVYGKYVTQNKPTGGIVLTCYSFIFGSIELLILILISKIPLVSDFLISKNAVDFANIPIFSGISSDDIIILLYISIFVTGVGFSAYFLAIEKMSVAMASLTFAIKPALGPILASIFLKEELGSYQLIGIIFVIVGSIGIIISQRNSAKKDSLLA
ncbi:Threonine/homoserine efflux transporter RhtA [Anaerosphaera aminiphila DSM 21120]|uniref:Threonine/homoserine efflux transporter RhtA n=1 Tax=Anaerosphaera aminiphila DSM 21120 TaxID=1120995 RepID=A0A1M5RZE9_9FIRM|nr:DMT family transporter [Anaerosphaera aminiphila]SHH31616.1 Threonine/homoserine efflux transporter RhtA [Anaerosphaera aminiphila DSM 21120]